MIDCEVDHGMDCGFRRERPGCALTGLEYGLCNWSTQRNSGADVLVWDSPWPDNLTPSWVSATRVGRGRACVARCLTRR
jgi:hypothetical protein